MNATQGEPTAPRPAGDPWASPQGGVPAGTPRTVGERRFQFGLRHLMLASVYFAFVFWRIASAIQGGGAGSIALALIVLALGVMVLGVYMIQAAPAVAFLGWVMIISSLAMAGWSTMGLFCIPAVSAALIAMMSVQIQKRRRDQEVMLWSLALTSGNGMPMPEAVEALAGQFQGPYRRWAFQFSGLLDSGQSVSRALERLPRLLPLRAQFLIHVGEDLGELPAAMELVAERHSRALDGDDTTNQFVYIAAVLIQIQAIVGFVMYFIVPKLDAIYRDYGLELPVVTTFVLRLTHFVIDTPLLPILMLLQLLLAAWILFSCIVRGRSGFPLINRVFRGTHTIQILRGLQIGLRKNRGGDSVIRCLSHWYPFPWVANRLEGVANAVDAGYDWCDSLRAFGLISASDAAVLNAAERAGNLSWALGQVADLNDRRHQNRVQVLARVGFMAAILGVGFIVANLAVAYFMPIVDMISRLAS